MRLRVFQSVSLWAHQRLDAEPRCKFSLRVTYGGADVQRFDCYTPAVPAQKEEVAIRGRIQDWGGEEKSWDGLGLLSVSMLRGWRGHMETELMIYDISPGKGGLYTIAKRCCAMMYVCTQLAAWLQDTSTCAGIMEGS
jgi:hypothetical protein